MTTSFCDALAAVLSAPSESPIDVALWVPGSRLAEVTAAVHDIATRAGSRPLVAGSEGPGSELPQLLAEERPRRPVVALLERDERLPLELCGRFVHLELDLEAVLDERLGGARALAGIDLRHAARARARWAACLSSAGRAVDRFREERWQDCYREGRTFSPLARRAVPRPWTYRVAERAGAAALMWQIDPERLIRGCIGPRLGSELAAVLRSAAAGAPPTLAESV